ncbi:Pleckstrin homology domain-containing family A member 7, partial [Trachymyrmex zeteki]
SRYLNVAGPRICVIRAKGYDFTCRQRRMKDGTGKGRPARREVGAERLRSVAAHQFARKRGAGRMRVASCERSVHVAANIVSSFPAPTPSEDARVSKEEIICMTSFRLERKVFKHRETCWPSFGRHEDGNFQSSSICRGSQCPHRRQYLAVSFRLSYFSLSTTPRFFPRSVVCEQSHRHLPGTLRGSLNHSHNHHHNHPHRHELPPSTYLTPPPPPPASSYITVQRGCALHSSNPRTFQTSRLFKYIRGKRKIIYLRKGGNGSEWPVIPLGFPVFDTNVCTLWVREREREGGKGACQLGPRHATSRVTPEFSPLLAGIARHGRATYSGTEYLRHGAARRALMFVCGNSCVTLRSAPFSRRIVQSSTPPAVPVQVRSKHDGSGVSASVSGVRRRSGPQGGLRSPAAKRPLSAPVALQGWLHKQGSEGLMLWKKRWFVLSEYCLFYYKGPEEEKLLGSILLPSYRVTVCKPEDKVNKKFAFKAEHANMRTYHFAADSRESMNQWVNALTLATLLQDPSPGAGEAPVVIEIAQDGERSARPSVSSISSILNQSADDSDSGFHGFQSRDDPSHASNNNSSPNSANTASFPNLSGSNSNGNSANNHASDSGHPMMNGWVQQSPQYGQPGTSQPQQQQHQQYGHLLPSQQLQPGHSHQHQALLHHHLPHQNALPTHQSSQLHKHVVQQSPQQQQQQPQQIKSPMSDYERNNTIYGTRMNQPSQQSLRIDKSGLHYGYGQTTQSTERRTPDTYGRSAKPRTSSRGNGDYEEVYGTPQLYQRPAGPVGYTKGASPAPIPIPVYAQQHLQQLHSPVITSPNMAMVRQSRAQPPPRPHSADFLEYEAARRPLQQPTQCERPPDQQRRPQRPKSSLDIVNPSDTTNDGYFYSEERYAAQMRQSAVYLHQTPQHYQQQRNQSLSRVTMQPKLPGIRDKTDENRISTLSDSSCPALRRVQRDHVHQQHTIPAQSLTQRHSEIMGADPKLRRSLREKSCEANGRETLTHGEDNTIPRRIPRGEYDGWGRAAGHGAHGTHIAQTCHAGHAGVGRRWNEQQQFCRSASARLPRTRHPAALDPDDDDYAERSSEQDSRDGERKIQQVRRSSLQYVFQREESMKRLLEWKQRMLQSPLTRKPSGSANRGRAQNDLSSYYKQQALLDLAAHEAAVAEGRHSRRREDGHRSHVRSKSSDGRRTAVNVPRYNSYSSDDEELGDVRRKRSRRPSHAGRSPRHAGDNRSSTATATSAVQDVTIPGTGRTSVNQTPQSQILNSRKANPGSTLSSLGGIPPDAGYDEVSFSPMMRNDYAYASSSADKQSLSRRSDPETAFEDPARHKTPKKPLGILKTSTIYGFDQQKCDGQQTSMIESNRSDNLCGYRTNESWHVQKNVQWDSKDDNDEWDPGIDESKVIKEFSYQYINPKKVPIPSKTEDESEKFETMNLVQCRIRSFEMNMDGVSPVKEVLTMQEPLKVSPLQATEAHVSKLDCANKTSSVIRSFALGDTNASENASKHKSVEEGHAKQASTDSNKSVKDLLADFERKSQQANRPKSEKRQESKHRGDYGDNETLRYDIGSNLDRRDRNDEKEKFVEKNEDITQHFTLDTLYTDAVQMQNSDESLKQNKMNSSKDSLTEQCVPSTDLNIIPSPSCARTSMTESLLTHSDQFSTDNDIISKQDDINSEDHYLPMSPRKAILDPNSDDRPHPKMMESLFADEESSYVEMAQNGMTRSLLAPNEDDRKHDSGDYSTLDPSSHYEFVCVRDNKMEPVYMEVNQLSEKEDEDGSKVSSMKKSNSSENSPHSRGDLPDILTALKSDSSDADDESSKDLESIDAPRHPRFSLSDTFRPASYYLGASRNMMAELHDSSDSELVSPPPIPTSPPPLDDLESLDMQESLEIKKVSPQVATMKDNVLNRDSPKSWNKPIGQMETHRPPSRKMKLMSSNLDRPFDYSGKNKTGSASSLPSMRVSDLPPTHQHSQSFTGDAHYENVASFSPLRGSPAVRSDSEPPRDHRMQSTSQSISALPISHSRDSSYSNASATASISTSMACQRPASAQSSMHSAISASMSSVNHGSTLTSMLQNVNAYSEQRFPNHSRSASHDTCVRHVLPNHRSTSSQNSSHYPNPMSMQIINSVLQQSYLPNADEQHVQSDQSGAPYYYSDLQASVNSVDMELTKPMIGHTSRLPQLNNQRDDAAIGLNKRNDIGRIVNPIARQMPRQIQVDDIDEARRIAAELRRTTWNVDNTEPTHVTQASHRRSRSLEGLLDDVGLQNLVEQRNRANRVTAATTTATAVTSTTPTSQIEATSQTLPSFDNHNVMTDSSFNSEDPWEQDSLWCESLRRVSLRNARSLDNLDSSPRPGRSDDAKSRGKITRGATYVNDSVVLRRDNCAEESSCGERPRVKRRTNKDHHTREQSIEDDDDVTYETLSMEMIGTGGYVWDPQNNTYHKPTVSDRNHFLEDGNLPPARSIPDARTAAHLDGGFGARVAGRGTTWRRSRFTTRLTPTTTMTTTTIMTMDTAIDNEQVDVIVKPVDIADVRDALPMKMPIKRQEPRQEPCKRAAASGSGSVIGRDPLPPRAVSTSHLPQRTLTQPPTAVSTLPLPRNATGSNHRQQPLPLHHSTPQQQQQSPMRQLENESTVHMLRAASNGDIGKCPGMSHYGVISSVASFHGNFSMSRPMNRAGGEAARLADLDTPRRLENLQKLEELKRHLMDLEKQYEKSKPLVNLVDNMVKLGSLYNRNTANGTSNVSGSRHDLHENARDHRDRLEFNQRVQEQRLLAEERRDWDRLSPDHGQLQAKVQQLYKLDRLLQEESGTLHSLQQDKEILEKALGGLRHKLQGSRSNLVEAERYRKQQLLLERELSRVRILLAHNSKKLEETVAENARLEQDLVVLRQKVQASRRYAGNVARDTSSTTAPLEAELRRVQQLVGDLQRQRKELSIQVRQLTEKSHSLVQQIRPQPPHAPQVHHSKKRTQNSWLETDLDSGITLDHGLDSPSSPSLSISPPNKQNDSSHQRYGSPTQYKDLSPLNRPHNQQSFVQPSQNHISTLSPQLREQIQQHQLKQQLLKDQMQGKGDYVADTSKHNGNVMNGTLNPAPEYIPPPPPPLSEEALLLNDNYRQNEDNKFAGLMHNREKQEIKTVRIVKRESERRQRDRGDRTGNLGIPLTNGLQAPGCAKRLSDDDFGGSQKFEKAQLGRVVEESPIVHAQSTVQLSELDDVQFQRSMSLPRGFGGQKQQTGVHYGPVVPPPRSDSMHALKTMMARRHKIRFESHDGSSDSTLSPYTDSPTSSSHMPMSSPNYSTASSYSPCQSQNYPSQATMVAAQSHYNNYSLGPYRQYEKIGTLAGAMSPELTSPTNVGIHERPTTATTANTNQSDSPQLSPVFKSEAAKQIIKEMTEKRVEGPRRRQIPREKRRHYTVSSSKPVLDLEDTFSKMGMGRARDDLDMERALRPRINAPDVVRSTLSHKELKYNESTIDQLLGTPNKIVIPERYIPEQTPELTAEEQEQRLKKAEAIRKMLSETTVTAPEGGDDDSNVEKSDTLKRKVVEEKRQREHILQLNQILAKQVMEKSKMVAVKALATLPLKTESSLDDEDLSPVAPLPLYQQRENFYS